MSTLSLEKFMNEYNAKSVEQLEVYLNRVMCLM